jgi:hypothetical protein
MLLSHRSSVSNDCRVQIRVGCSEFDSRQRGVECHLKEEWYQLQSNGPAFRGMLPLKTSDKHNYHEYV